MNGKLPERETRRGNQLSVEQIQAANSKVSHQGHVTIGNLVLPDLTQPACLRTPSVEIFTRPTSKSNRFGSLTPKSKAQRQPKSGSPSSIEDGQKTPLFGLSTLESVTGIFSDRGKRTARMETRNRRISLSDRSTPIVSSCLFILFAASITSTTIASHNLHGFKKSAAYHKACIQNNNGVWFSQEHWLSETQLPTLKQLGTQFAARSGMEDAISKRLLVGRPYGGVCISWSPQLDPYISPIANFRHKRVVAVELNTSTDKFLLICIYMPFYNSSARSECMTETIDAIAMIENLIEQHPSHGVIIGGDINSELRGNSPYDAYWTELMSKFKLSSCDPCFSPSTITYRHASLNHNKWSDHFIVSESLLQRALLTDHKTPDEGKNISDHLPILMTLSAKFEGNQFQIILNFSQPKLKWDKLTLEQKTAYTDRLQSAMATSAPPMQLSFCQKRCRCNSDQCHLALQQEYDMLTNAIKKADLLLPRYKPGVEKDWWTEQLTSLKNKSIDIHSL